MSDTPKTDAAKGEGRFANCVDVDFVRELERELNRIRNCVRVGPHGEFVVTLDEPHDREDVKRLWDEALKAQATSE